MIPYSMDYLRRHLRVCIYARVSTEHEAQLSALENQLDWYKPLLELHPEWTLVEQYIDEGITGTSAEKRGEFMRMIEDAKQHKFDMILTREVSRFARNTVDTLQYTRMLKEHGVEVYFINDGIKTFDGDGELRLTIMATLAQDESRKTSIRVKSGQQTSMNNGVFYGNGNILGYTRIETILPDKTKQVDFVIDPEQAETVRMIYDMYLDGYGLVKIKDELELRGRKTSQGKDKWFPTVISHVLKNSFYCGIITYHKEYTPDYLKQKKVKNYGEIEFTQTQGKHEPIVTVEEYERVQRIMESKTNNMPYLNKGSRRGKHARATVWGKLLICECGHTFNTRRWDRPDRQPGNAYQCYSSIQTGSYESRKKKGLPLEGICRSPMVPEWRLQMMANLIFRNYLSEKEKVLALANSILEGYNENTDEDRRNEAALEMKQRELTRLQKRMDNLIEMRADGDLSREMFRMKTEELETKMQKLQKEIEELSVKHETKAISDYKEKLTVLQYALSQYSCPKEGEDVPESVIEAFVVKIVVSKDGFDWYLRFDGDPDKPRHCKLEGKRKSTTKVVVTQDFSPALDSSTTGCNQGLIRNPKHNQPLLERGAVFCDFITEKEAVSIYNENTKRHIGGAAMNYSALIQNRKSVREFTDKPISATAVERIKNHYRKITPLVKDLETELRFFDTGARAALEGAAGYHQFLVGAPRYMVLLSEEGNLAYLNAGYIMEELVLKLTDMNLSSCWVTFHDSDTVKKALRLDSPLSVAAIVAFGHGKKTTKRLRLNIRSMSDVDVVAQHRYMEPKKSVRDMTYVQQWGNTEELDSYIGFFDDMLWESLYGASLAPSYLNRQAYGFLLHDGFISLVSRPDAYNTRIDGDLSLGIVLQHFTSIAENWAGKLNWKLYGDAAKLELPEGHKVIATCAL